MHTCEQGCKLVVLIFSAVKLESVGL